MTTTWEAPNTDHLLNPGENFVRVVIGMITTAGYYKILQRTLFRQISGDVGWSFRETALSKLLKFLETKKPPRGGFWLHSLAERAGFEPAVRLYSVRQFSKLLV